MLDGRCFGAMLVGLSVGCAYDFGVFDDGGGGASSTTSSADTTSGESTTSSAMGGKGGGGGTGGELPKTCGDGVLDAQEQCDDALEADPGLCDGCLVACPTVDADGVDQFFDVTSRHCYVVFSTSDLGFEPAKTACSAWRPRARLVSITSDAEHALVTSHLVDDSFLGAVYEGNGWVWPGEGPMSLTYWQRGEPDGLACITMETDGLWDSHFSCEDYETDDFICEWEPAGSSI